MITQEPQFQLFVIIQDVANRSGNCDPTSTGKPGQTDDRVDRFAGKPVITGHYLTVVNPDAEQHIMLIFVCVF